MQSRQTTCRHCGQDIEGFSPYRKGEWHDRGNNTHCPNDSGRVHGPYADVPKYPGYRTMTAAQRYNARAERIWDAARDAKTRFNSTSREGG
jgi:hypothetical protein